MFKECVSIDKSYVVHSAHKAPSLSLTIVNISLIYFFTIKNDI